MIYQMSQELDWKFYTKLYSDLSWMNEEEAQFHWIHYGKCECRFPNLNAFAGHCKIIEFEPTEDGINDFYTNVYKWPTEFTTEKVPGKTAIVFSGQLRTFNFCKHFQSKLFQNLESYDVFCLLCDTDDFEEDKHQLEEWFGDKLKLCMSWDELPSEWKEFELDTASKVVDIHRGSDFYKETGIAFPFPVNRPIQRRTWMINIIAEKYGGYDNMIIGRYDHIPTLNYNPTLLKEYDIQSLGDYFIMGSFDKVSKMMNYISRDFLKISEQASHRVLHWAEYFLFTGCSNLGLKLYYSDIIPPPRTYRIAHTQQDIDVCYVKNYNVFIPTLKPDNIPGDFDCEYYAESLGLPFLTKIACLRHWVWHGHDKGMAYKRPR